MKAQRNIVDTNGNGAIPFTLWPEKNCSTNSPVFGNWIEEVCSLIEPKPSSLTEIPSQDHFKIRASEPLSRDPSHRAMIRPSQAKIKLQAYNPEPIEPLSQDPSHRVEIRAKSS
uniref:Uncharacterized protein n=1 Tax=Fagus sylvatica TaxID=28930 RepID=A0A2N9GFA1_FAGSY